MGDLTPFWSSPKLLPLRWCVGKAWPEETGTRLCEKTTTSCRSSEDCICFSPGQEVILKRAADLVEALYGMPHNNQVSALGLEPSTVN